MDPQYYGAAAEYNKPKGFNLFSRKTLIIAGVVLAALVSIMVLFAVLGSVASGPRNEVAKLAARSQQLYSFLDSNSRSVKNPALKKIVAETKLYISTASLASANAYGGKLPDSIVNSEADTTTASKLSAATTAGKFDETFLQIMTEKVSSTLEQSQKVQAQGGGPQTKAAAEQTTNSMKTVSEQLAAVKL